MALDSSGRFDKLSSLSFSCNPWAWDPHLYGPPWAWDPHLYGSPWALGWVGVVGRLGGVKLAIMERERLLNTPTRPPVP